MATSAINAPRDCVSRMMSVSTPVPINAAFFTQPFLFGEDQSEAKRQGKELSAARSLEFP